MTNNTTPNTIVNTCREKADKCVATRDLLAFDTDRPTPQVSSIHQYHESFFPQRYIKLLGTYGIVVDEII